MMTKLINDLFMIFINIYKHLASITNSHPHIVPLVSTENRLVLD